MNDHDSSIQQNLIRRLNLIEGQTRGIKKMIAEERLCSDIIHQLDSIRAALKSLQVILLHQHINTFHADEKSRQEMKEFFSVIKRMC